MENCMLLAKHRIQEEVARKLVQELLTDQELARLEPEGPRARHWLPCWVSNSSAGPFTHQVILKGVGPQFCFDNLSNPVEF